MIDFTDRVRKAITIKIGQDTKISGKLKIKDLLEKNLVSTAAGPLLYIFEIYIFGEVP